MKSNSGIDGESFLFGQQISRVKHVLIIGVMAFFVAVVWPVITNGYILMNLMPVLLSLGLTAALDSELEFLPNKFNRVICYIIMFIASWIYSFFLPEESMWLFSHYIINALFVYVALQLFFPLVGAQEDESDL